MCFLRSRQRVRKNSGTLMRKKCDWCYSGHIFNYYFTKVDITLASVKSFSYICSRFQEVGKDIGKKVTLETHKGNIEVMSGLSKPNFNYKSLKPY